MNIDFSHLDSLSLGLSHERARLAAAKIEAERTMRAVWVAQLEREIAYERSRLGLPQLDDDMSHCNISDDDLLRELTNGGQ